jgi:CubicO group peptidase (beta-lactamase class C family)
VPSPVDVLVQGSVEPGFEAVRRTFAETLALPGEGGAAFAATVDGEVVVDLWGGMADTQTGRAWERDSLQVIFSGTKGLVAVCLLLLADRGEINLDAPVCEYWPEFAAAGKEGVLVVDLVTHSARLPGIRTPLAEDDLVDDRRLAALLAEQPQEDDPRAADAYHAFTYGWLCGELVRRVSGRSIGRYFDDEIARPLGLHVWIGLPPEREARVTRLSYGPDWGQRPQWDAERLAADPLLARVWDNPPLFPDDHLPWNRPDWHQAEIPAAGGIATARSMARLYGCLACDGEIDDVPLLSPAAVRRGRSELARRREPLIDEPQAFGVGFQLQTELHMMGPPADAFGHGGAGGSMHCAWPSRRVGISYAMNTLRDGDPVDHRVRAILRTLHDALDSAS